MLTDAGELLEAVQIANSPLAPAEVMTRAGEHPEVVLESTYGSYWAVDVLQGLPCEPGVHLAHPLGVKAFEYRRLKNDLRDAADLADLLRMGRLPESWIAPPATRELRKTVRHRARLVALRSGCKAQVHAVLPRCRARPADAASSRATASSGPTVATERCQVRRSASASSPRQSASARCTPCRRPKGAPW